MISEDQLLEKIDNMRDEIIKFHQEIVRIPSENPPSKYKEVARFVEKKMSEIGLKTSIKRNNVIGEFNNGGGSTLIFNGHFDTVEAFKGWTKDPFGAEIVGDKIYGRGASDDKSSVTAEIFATQVLLEAGVDLKGKLIVTAVVDEETGGLRGAEYLLSNELVSGDACLLGDAANGYPFGYCGGTMYITITIKGKTAHGLAFPDLPTPYRNENSGINTIERMVKVMNFLLELKEELLTKTTNYPTSDGWGSNVSSINLAEIHGGTKITTVPDRCYLHLSVNTIPEQNVASIKKRLLDFVEKMKEEDPDLDISVQIPIAMEPQVIDESSEFAKIVQKVAEKIHGEKREFKTLMPSTDAHWFQERGIPTILVGASARDNNIHAEDEFVYIKDLMDLVKMFALTALNYLK
ncbi:MAG: M20 family metallopeptidase [Candidatus Lokiarchaeota archaeon]|nr:M20 family metallopeptidase [Candidatus Lokiarchaeota archaeon]